MDPKRWQQIKSILDIALEKDSYLVASYLDRVCAGDNSLRADVESFIKMFEETKESKMDNAIGLLSSNLTSLTETTKDQSTKTSNYNEINTTNIDLSEISKTSKGTILVVDDLPNNLSLLSGLLSIENYQVSVANNGRRALKIVETLSPDLILLDINMPEMDGYELCTLLKASPKSSAIPVIFISALDEVLDKVKAFEVGGVDYITKPFQTKEVIARVENQLKIFRLQQELQKNIEELAKKNQELAEKNQELIESYRKANHIFTVLAQALPGTILDDKYKLEEKIGSGGFGAVYRATHIPMKRAVAVKVFRPSLGNDSVSEFERFQREAISICRVNHPNAVNVFDSGISSQGIAYIVMELLTGHTLAKELSEKTVISLRRCAEILLPICEVLSKAHSEGIIHRDIKPDNVFLHQTSLGEVIKVIDFGIAKLIKETPSLKFSDLTAVEGFIGTPNYMAPERIQNADYDGKADVYSLGVMLYEMLGGRRPFSSSIGSSFGVLSQHLNEIPPSIKLLNRGVPDSIEVLVMRTLEKDPNLRPTAKELGEEFLNVLIDLEANSMLP